MENLERFEDRKRDHIRLSLESRTQALTPNEFDRVGLVPEALPELDFSEVHLDTKLLHHPFRSPHFISSMTGGHKCGPEINAVFAEAAGELSWLFCIGSQKRELLDPSAATEWKKIRARFKKTKFVSNIGLEEVISYKPKEILRLVDSTEAIGLIVHLNSLQEIFQNKKDVKMRGGLRALNQLVRSSPVPVIIKEVGFGISKPTVKKLFTTGIAVIDVAGKGGTHWGMIEALRQPRDGTFMDSAQTFVDWGLSAVRILRENQDQMKKHHFWASGGIRSGMHSAKSLALGARAVGIARPLMEAVIETSRAKDISVRSDALENLKKKMRQFDFELRAAMFCMGLKDLKAFSKRKVWYDRG